MIKKKYTGGPHVRTCLKGQKWLEEANNSQIDQQQNLKNEFLGIERRSSHFKMSEYRDSAADIESLAKSGK